MLHSTYIPKIHLYYSFQIRLCNSFGSNRYKQTIIQISFVSLLKNRIKSQLIIELALLIHSSKLLIGFIIQSIQIIQIVFLFLETLNYILTTFQLSILLVNYDPLAIVLYLFIHFVVFDRIPNFFYQVSETHSQLEYLILLMLRNIFQSLVAFIVVNLLVILQKHF